MHCHAVMVYIDYIIQLYFLVNKLTLTHLNKLLLLWYPVTEVWGVQHIMYFLAYKWKQSRLLKCHASLNNETMDRVQKKNKIMAVNFSHALFFGISSPSKMGPIGCPETLVRNCRSMLCNIAEDWRFHMIIWWCRPWFRCAWSISVRSGLAWCSSAFHMQI